MGNRQLSNSELDDLFQPLLEETRASIRELAGPDNELAWALRRKLYKELSYDERGKPTHRKRLKAAKRDQQNGLCALCGESLPEKGAVLDRYEAMSGYTEENTRLLCPICDTQVQTSQRYS